jgi:carbon-monoxide dehydrogenase small subunit
MATDKMKVVLTVNGKRSEHMAEPRYLLADYLRHVLGLKGTHIGCEHGVCGACTILLDGRTARSCLHFAVDVSGSEIVTVEGLGNGANLDPVQQAFHDHHALQCGFCTPGFLVTVHEFLAENDNPTQDEIRRALTNNLCRCTGYANIVAAVEAAAAKLREAKQAREGGAL